MGWVEREIGRPLEKAILSPLGDLLEGAGRAVGDVLWAMREDPIKAILQVAAVATNNAWALPLIEAGDVALDGGSLEDSLKAAAKAYVAQQVGSYVGKAVSSAVTDAAAAISAANLAATAASLLGVKLVIFSVIASASVADISASISFAVGS